MFWFWNKEDPLEGAIIISGAPPRQPNRYLFGTYIFAEWVDDPREEESWEFYSKVDAMPIGFCTDTEENAKLLLVHLDHPGWGVVPSDQTEPPMGGWGNPEPNRDWGDIPFS